MIITILIAFFSLIGLMVLHEFGHFVFAKKFGVDVEEFGIGYPPRIFGKKFGKTIYSLNLVPFGAFVKIKGEIGGVEDYKAFFGKPIWQRIFIVLGGVISFWAAAFVLLTILAGFWGLPIEVSDQDSHNLTNPKIQITAVASDSPAAEAGLKVGDTVLEFNKIGELQDFTKANQGKETSITIKRGKETMEKKIIPRISPPEDEGPLGVALARIALRHYSWREAPVRGAVLTGQLTYNILHGWVLGLKNILGLEKLPEGAKMELMGPIGIFSLLREYFELGVNYFLFLISLISVALALGNLLPIPALDGGKLVFLAIEFIRGKAINYKIEQKITAGFFIALIILMIFVTIKFDIPRIF